MDASLRAAKRRLLRSSSNVGVRGPPPVGVLGAQGVQGVPPPVGSPPPVGVPPHVGVPRGGARGEWAVGPGWDVVLADEMRRGYFQKLKEFVAEERRRHVVYPEPGHVFTWTHLCEPSQVRVVIVGQDPYHGPGQAHGLSFSVPRGVPPPPSLRNIYREGGGATPPSRPPHGDLTAWAQQGVLLLNTVLTVRAGLANSHRGRGWELLTGAVISWLNHQASGLVFLLWGAEAQRCGASISRSKHHVLTAPHPSPLSAHRGFLGCGHFSRTNSILQAQGLAPIDWLLHA
ncbi:uracil-DNA glycosylase [Lampetra fluviatilis]